MAQAAGCSKAVVSAVLNGSRGNIGASEQLRRRVTEAAQRLGYRTHFASQSLALQRTRTLGVYIDPLYGGGIAGHYHAAILSGIEAAAAEHRYDVLLVNFAGDTTVAGCIDKIGQARIDGLLLLHTGRNEMLIDAVLEATSKVVAIDTLDPPERIQAVSYDHAGAMRLAVDHLAGLGHRRLGYVGPFTTRPIPHNRARVAAFRAAAAESRLKIDDAAVFLDEQMREKLPQSPSSGAYAAERFLALPPAERPTALVVYNDRIAADLLARLQHAGLEVPRDVSLLNFENTPITRVTTPPLTCLDHPVTPMAHRGTTRLIELIESAGPDPGDPAADAADPWHRVFPAELILRGSTAPPPAGGRLPLSGSIPSHRSEDPE
ncbi:MAG: LacI family DNA-binding transcriptional regulator [Planctomycetota bacterium]